MNHLQWCLLLASIMNMFLGIVWTSETMQNAIVKTILFGLAGWGILELLATGIVTGIKIF